ncbi:tol-pal system protein YbgF [Methylomonas sp. MgM2]
MKKTALLTLCVSIGGCTNAGALPPATNSDYQGNMTYGAPSAQVDAPSNSAIYDLLGRLEQLQSEVQQLRGLVEEQAHAISDLERKQDNMYSDLDERIQLLTSGAQAAPQAATETAQAGADASQAAVQTASSSDAAAASSVTNPNDKSAAQEPAVVENDAAEPVEPAAAKLSEQERYQQAYETLRNGHNAQAIKMFEALYADNPTGQYGDNAQYWLGEAYKINREFDKARDAFNKVISQYPDSSKVPDALLKLGYIEYEQQNPAKARDYFTRITTSYPGTTAAHLAAKKLANMPQ